MLSSGGSQIVCINLECSSRDESMISPIISPHVKSELTIQATRTWCLAAISLENQILRMGPEFIRQSAKEKRCLDRQKSNRSRNDSALLNPVNLHRRNPRRKWITRVPKYYRCEMDREGRIDVLQHILDQASGRER
jgi:hypothetical protein